MLRWPPEMVKAWGSPAAGRSTFDIENMSFSPMSTCGHFVFSPRFSSSVRRDLIRLFLRDNVRDGLRVCWEKHSDDQVNCGTGAHRKDVGHTPHPCCLLGPWNSKPQPCARPHGEPKQQLLAGSLTNWTALHQSILSQAAEFPANALKDSSLPPTRPTREWIGHQSLD